MRLTICLVLLAFIGIGVFGCEGNGGSKSPIETCGEVSEFWFGCGGTEFDAIANAIALCDFVEEQDDDGELSNQCEDTLEDWSECLSGATCVVESGPIDSQECYEVQMDFLDDCVTEDIFCVSEDIFIPQPLSFTNISVPADMVWFNTGIDLALGELLTLLASGTAYVCTPADTPCAVQADGYDPTTRSRSLVPGLPAYALIGRVGVSGTPFFVGLSYTGTATEDGSLYLTMNDEPGGFGDNSGNWLVSGSVADSCPFR